MYRNLFRRWPDVVFSASCCRCNIFSFFVYAYEVGWTFDICPLSCEMAAAFVICYMMKHCIVGGMDLQDFPLTIIEAFFNDQNFKGAWDTFFFFCVHDISIFYRVNLMIEMNLPVKSWCTFRMIVWICINVVMVIWPARILTLTCDILVRVIWTHAMASFSAWMPCPKQTQHGVLETLTFFICVCQMVCVFHNEWFWIVIEFVCS